MNAMNEGVALAQQHRDVEAVEKLERAGAIDPTNDMAFYNLALVHLEMRNLERAKETLQKAIAVRSDAAGYHDKLGTVLMQLKDWAGAKAELERAVQLDASLFRAYFKLGQALEHLDDQQGALEKYTEAARRGPRFLEAYSSLGRLYADLGYLDQAVQVFQSGLQVAIEGTDDAATLHDYLGTVYQQQRKFDEAVKEFRAALDVDPSRWDALFALGWTYAMQNNREEAKRFLRRFVEVGGDAPAYYMKAAQDRLHEIEGTP